jgi:hypothetical protein
MVPEPNIAGTAGIEAEEHMSALRALEIQIAIAIEPALHADRPQLSR